MINVFQIDYVQSAVTLRWVLSLLSAQFLFSMWYYYIDGFRDPQDWGRWVSELYIANRNKYPLFYSLWIRLE